MTEDKIKMGFIQRYKLRRLMKKLNKTINQVRLYSERLRQRMDEMNEYIIMTKKKIKVVVQPQKKKTKNKKEQE